MPSQTPSTVQHIATHILTQLDIHRSKFPSSPSHSSSQSPHTRTTTTRTTTPTARPTPLFTALQGPQGSGKSHTTHHLAQYLSSPPHNLHIATLSLDDLYLPHSALYHASHTDNPLLRGRGLPGTHDIALAGEVLTRLKYINDYDGGAGGLKRINDDYDDDGEGGGHVVHLPVYDKSLFNGQGDRSTHTVVVHTPPALDVVLLEGWCMGFYPVSEGVLDVRWDAWTKGKGGSGSGAGTGAKKDGAGNEGNGRAGICGKEDVREINDMLEGYVGIWELFDTFVQIKPSPPPPPPPPAPPPTSTASPTPSNSSPTLTSASEYDTASPSAPTASEYAIIYTWRLQQEHAMKAQNGGRGMSDDEVVRFVDRYIPGYFFFGDGVREGYNVGRKSGEDKDKDAETRADTETRTDAEGGADKDADADKQGDNKPGADADTKKQKQKQKLPPWIGKSLVVTIGPDRQVLEVGHF